MSLETQADAHAGRVRLLLDAEREAEVLAEQDAGSAETTAITCSGRPFAPRVASTTAVPATKPIPQATMPTS